jgi:hypothetical protein
MLDPPAPEPAGPRDSAATVTSAPPASLTSGADSAGDNTFYRYVDARGRLVIVDSISRVPSSARGSLETMVIARHPEAPAASLSDLSRQTLHWPSFGAGAACALVAVCLWLALRRVRMPLVRFSLLGGFLLLGAGAYFGWMRRLTGQSGSLISSPAALIEDARTAVGQMNERTRERQRILKELESQP